MARQLRITHGLKQREVATAIGVQPSTYGNLESSPYKIIRRERVDDMARLYKLDKDQYSELIAAWDRAPISDYSAKQRKGWEKRNEARSKGKQLEIVKLALCDVIDWLASSAAVGEPVEAACDCRPPDPFMDEDGRTCELCLAMHALGFPDGWVSGEVASARIAEISPIAPNQRPVVPNTPHIPKSSTGSPEKR